MPAPTEQESIVETVLGRIRRHESVLQPLPADGILSIDRELPYLLVYRHPPHHDPGTVQLLTAEASYAVGGRGSHREVARLIQELAEAGSAEYGSFLLLELWAAADVRSRRFTLKGPDGPAPETMRALESGLRELGDVHPAVDVRVEDDEVRHPPGLPALLSVHESWESGILLLGLEVPPIYRDPETETVYPRFLRRLQARLSDVLRRGLYEFIRVQTTCHVPNYRALGTRTLPDAVWAADRDLASVERSYELLLLTSPVNEAQAWRQFRADGFGRNPEFHYRLLPMDPDLVKRRLFDIPIEDVDDPAVASLFRDKREELDKQLSMLRERGTPAFRYGSQSLYGAVDDRLLAVAKELLSTVPPAGPPPPRASGSPAERVDANTFKEAAEAELAHYAAAYPELSTRIQVRPDIVGLMVSEGNLLIGERLQISPARVSALLHHEVGTHVLTYVNGSAQPLQQLALGLADYDELQEGLAVLSEYLVGGLNRSRMRLLAARVVAAHSVEQGAEFVDTFRLLTEEHGFRPSRAWNVCTRVHQCGGFTRDLIYLRGLVSLLDHLRDGGDLEPLYIGKLAQKHIPIIEELRHRGVLREPPLRPRFLEQPEARQRLDTVHQGITLTEMISSKNR